MSELKKVPLVCLDPGHGGYDSGAAHGNDREKDITLRIGLQLRDILRRAGFGVVMTRDTDTSPGGFTEVNADLNERCRIANAANAGVFLSIHVNAGGGTGAEIYANGDGGPIRPLANGIVTNVGTIDGIHGGQAIRDGGRTGEGWRVIVGTNMDAMLLEIGFIDSGDLEKIEAHLEEFAQLIAHAFCSFYGVPYPDEQAVIDPAAAQEAVDELGRLSKVASREVLVAYNFCANAIRRAARLQVVSDMGKPTPMAAKAAEALLGALWTCTDADHAALRAWYHVGADAARSTQNAA